MWSHGVLDRTGARSHVKFHSVSPRPRGSTSPASSSVLASSAELESEPSESEPSESPEPFAWAPAGRTKTGG